MNIEIKSDRFELNDRLKHFATCCAGFELGTHKSNIRSLRMRLSDAGMPGMSKKQCCRVEVEMNDGHRILTRARDLDLHFTIFRVLERAGRLVARRQRRLQLAAGNTRLPVLRSPGRAEPELAA